MATSKGRIRTQQKNVQSTKGNKITTYLPLSTSLDINPAQESINQHTHIIFIALEPCSGLRKSYSDQTGKFPHISSHGNKYIMIMYDYVSNIILSEPIKNIQAAETTRAWKDLFIQLQQNGQSPELHILDNKFSDEMKKSFQKYQVTFQPPPYVHRRNAVEHAIQTWKNHFLAGIASLDPQFSIKEWYRLLPLCTISLNLL